jgi:hypothetical protein
MIPKSKPTPKPKQDIEDFSQDLFIMEHFLRPAATSTSRPCFYSNQYEYKQLYASQLQSHQEYQRPVDPKHVRDIVENFDPLYLEEVWVSHRNGRYYVIDGQNRIAAFKRMSRSHDCLVNCKVFRGLTYEQEADMFYHLDSIKKKLRYCDTIRAKAEAKNDPVVLDITRILETYGVTWSFRGSGNSSDGMLKASKVLVDSYTALGPQMFEQVIRLLIRTWKGNRESMTAAFIKGLSLFVKAYARDADEEIFIKKLCTATPAEIKSLARAEISAPRDDIKYARVFLTRYNFRASKKLAYRLD